MARINVKVIPKASRAEVVGTEGETLKVKLTAPPEGGRANKQLIEVLAKHFKVPKSAITIVKGETSRQKIVEIEGI
ncbi:MAG: YggU family protein [Nitrospirae bacterium]|nr:MAG: YggU family protein [Nitrospirota bacterium]